SRRHVVCGGEAVQVPAEDLPVDRWQRKWQEPDRGFPGLHYSGRLRPASVLGTGAIGPGLLDGVVELDLVEHALGDLFRAAVDGVDCGFSDELGKTADQPASALVEVIGHGDQGAGTMGL